MYRIYSLCQCLLVVSVIVWQQEGTVMAFRSAARLSSRGKFGSLNSRGSQQTTTFLSAMRKTALLEREDVVTSSSYDPLHLASSTGPNHGLLTPPERSMRCRPKGMGGALAATTGAFLPLALADKAMAVETAISRGNLDPSTFQPICPASDVWYRVLQKAVESVVGTDKFIEYGPLIAGGLLRVRLELCVVESFFNEAVGPFIKENGLAWVLPLHETVETFLAGSIFALASTFILVGSTKLLSVTFSYIDLLFGYPSRTFGGFIYDRALGRPVTLDLGFGPFKTRVIGPSDEVLEKNKERELVDLTSPGTLLVVTVFGSLKIFGQTTRFLRASLESFDLFVGRYLVLFATGYIGIKFVHYKIFPDFPNF